MQDLIQLIDIVATLEEGLATKELSENTANRPDVDWSRVSRVLEDDAGWLND